MSPDRAPADIYKLYSNLSLLGLILKNKTVNAVFSANQIQVFSIIDSLAHLLRGLNVPGLSGESEDGRGNLAYKILLWLYEYHTIQYITIQCTSN